MNKVPNVLFLVDVSGSMGDKKTLMNQKLNPLFSAIDRKEVKANLGLALFSDRYPGISWSGNRMIEGSGGTYLYGSAIEMIRELTSRFNAADKCLIVMVTDGHDEDRSRRYGPQEVAQEVNLAEDVLGWDFLFIGTNMDAMKVGSEMGVKASKTLSFANSNDGFVKMLESVDKLVRDWAEGNIGHNDDFFGTETRETQRRLGARV